MKIFTKEVSGCHECPNIGYHHVDGEGESAPYSWSWAYCCAPDQERKYLPVEDLKYGKDRYGNMDYNRVPKRKIPKWCPLKNKASK